MLKGPDAFFALFQIKNTGESMEMIGKSIKMHKKSGK